MFSPDNAALVNGWGLVIGIAGLILSLLGFGFTIQQLVRTSKATEAVKGAVSNLRNRMAAFDYASECLRAGKSLQHTVQLLRLRQWADAAAALVEVQGTLHRVSIRDEGRPEGRALAGDT